MKLSVCMITYNHERYLAEALDSALAQQTRFPFEIVVGEDCSKDSTRAVLLDYAARHPGRIRALLPEQNLGVNRNLITTLSACTGEYVALLEGDDYWTDPTKLQKQIDLLDSNRSLSMCFHDVKVEQTNGGKSSQTRAPRRPSRRFSMRDLLDRGNFIPTCSVVFRNHLIERFPDWFFTLRIGDYPLNLFNAEHGEIGFLPELMGVYRLHPGGTFSAGQQTRNVEEVCRMLECLRQHYAGRYENNLASMISYWRAVELFRTGNLAEGQVEAARCLGERPLTRRVAAAAIMAWTPSLYVAMRSAKSWLQQALHRFA